ncbi:MAG: hypothetical protein KF784_09180 [Fimbriimonadaceae bacterium]|nr:hypothetical protein [Fimbriimonadaceae bacterium]
MRYLLFALIFAALIGCGNSTEPAPDSGGGKAGGPDVKVGTEGTSMNKPIDGLQRYALGAPITEGNVTVVPVLLVSNNEQEHQEDYMSLAEAKKLGLVEISELGGGGQVSHLMVHNMGKKPLLLLAGELMLGGQQDRVVAKDTVVPPGEQMKVPVFCVEEGRWQGGKNFEYSSSMVPNSVRDDVMKGEQSEVWRSVHGYNQAVGGSADTSSVRGGQFAKQVQERVDADISAFLKALDGQKDAVGIVYIANGEIQSFDLFGSSSLLKASQESLLKGFLADAAARPSDKAKNADLKSVEAFIKESLLGNRNQTTLAGRSAGWNVSGTNVTGAETTVETASRPALGAAVEQKDLLHGSYTPKK